MDSVLIDTDCVATIVSSALEVYNKETSGYIMSRPNRIVKKIEGKRTRVVNLSYAYPFQTDKRTPTYVFHKNTSAATRVIDSLFAMGVELIGGFHSHIYPHDTAYISDNDVAYAIGEMKILEENGIHLNRWLELIIAVKKKTYKTSQKIGYKVKNVERGIKIDITTDEKIGFDLTIVGYWIMPKGKEAVKREAHIHTKFRGKII